MNSMNKNQYKDIIRVKEDANKVISGFLMNEINQNLVSLKWKIDLMELRGGCGLDGLKDFNPVKKILNRSIERIREISIMLYPLILDDLGFINAVRSLLYEFEKKTKSKIEFNCNIVQREVDNSITLYRLIQEILLMLYSTPKPIFVNFELTKRGSRIIMKFSQKEGFSEIKKILENNSNNKSYKTDRFRNVNNLINLLDGNVKITLSKIHQDKIIIIIPIK
jgi:signal transduction histidine kinase